MTKPPKHLFFKGSELGMQSVGVLIPCNNILSVQPGRFPNLISIDYKGPGKVPGTRTITLNFIAGDAKDCPEGDVLRRLVWDRIVDFLSSDSTYREVTWCYANVEGAISNW